MSDDAPRAHHYLFAHRALPQSIHGDPKKSQELLSGPEGDHFLTFLWRRVGERLADDAKMPPQRLVRTVRKQPDGTVIVAVTMPAPTRPPEAYFVAAVFSLGPRKLLFFREPPTVRYLTLEYGSTLDGAPRTVLCGWDKEGSHFNMGDGPPPELEAFLDAVRGRG